MSHVSASQIQTTNGSGPPLTERELALVGGPAAT